MCGEKSAYFESENTQELMENINPYYEKKHKVDELLAVKDNFLKIEKNQPGKLINL